VWAFESSKCSHILPEQTSSPFCFGGTIRQCCRRNHRILETRGRLPSVLALYLSESSILSPFHMFSNTWKGGLMKIGRLRIQPYIASKRIVEIIYRDMDFLRFSSVAWSHTGKTVIRLCGPGGRRFPQAFGAVSFEAGSGGLHSWST
jgi:hypothetical protein